MTERQEVQYARFAVVCFVDEATSGVIQELRRLIPPRIAVMSAHVTVRGSFVEPACLRTIEQRIAREVRCSGPLQVPVSEVSVQATHVELRLVPTQALTAVHDRLYAVLADVVRDVYGDKPGAGYHPHMTVFYDLTPEDRMQALEVIPALRKIRALALNSVSLVGRVGSSRDGYWEEVRSFPLGQCC